ncbi:hypothetical protein H6G76_24980 [Nostoc sp. FACHB-152]|uniref:hypothetical protein n=1 Tax=unclassified Nostoc TaxID=2593658 RepID=UPI0016895F2A|nr:MULTISPECIES: hypothetical protein [unclassified Nostoc]MBD2450351.1 hypothetical protein [Nostoc sp. FACHB-152]MBD2472134.1 hypothetical protein [Nostoc sp. FACHB-145]
MTPQINLSLPQGVSQSWQSVQYFVNQGVNSVSNSAQHVGQSWQETATSTTSKAIDVVTTNLEQAKGSLEQFKNTTSGAMETAIASSIKDWLTQHPAMSRLLQMLNWAAIHPVISLVILLFSLAILWSIINAIIRLFTTASFSLLQAPFKLLLSLIKVSFLFLNKVARLALQKNINYQPRDNISTLSPNNIQNFYLGKEQRLAEISCRLEEINQEQKKLLQEAAQLISMDTINLKTEEGKAKKIA